MLVVNLFGSPGTGKSTLSAYIFSQLKLMGVNCELVSEFAKDLVWEENYKPWKINCMCLDNNRIDYLGSKIKLI